MRQKISSGSPYEADIGFSRAVRAGSILAISGTAPVAEDGSVACPGDVYGQTLRCLQIIGDAIAEARLSIEDVLRTRIMLRDIDSWRGAARAHSEIFGGVNPACTFVEVSRFIDPEWLVEIEADCVVPACDEQ